jgi:hypothetical protein
MTAKRKRSQKPKLDSDPEEYKRFLETAKAAEASNDPKEFDRAFDKIARPKRHG